jgi:hypothetical protein
MGKRWVVIIVTFGDGKGFGHRVHSITFNTLAAADQAVVFMRNSAANVCKTTIVEDWA